MYANSSNGLKEFFNRVFLQPIKVASRVCWLRTVYTIDVLKKSLDIRSFYIWCARFPSSSSPFIVVVLLLGGVFTFVRFTYSTFSVALTVPSTHYTRYTDSVLRFVCVSSFIALHTPNKQTNYNNNNDKKNQRAKTIYSILEWLNVR